MWTKRHKIFFAALLVAHVPSLTKKELKSNGFSGSDITIIDQLAADFKTGEMISDEKVGACMSALKSLTSNILHSDTNFLQFCERYARINANALRYLCDHGLYKDPDQRTPIFYVAGKGTKADAVQLLKAGAQHTVRDTYGYTPLTLASINNNGGAMEAFLEAGANADSQDKEGATALHFAAQLGHANLFSLLVKHGAVVDRQCKKSMTPFGAAVIAEQYACARILAKQFKCSVDYLDKDGATLMQDACREFNDYMNENRLSEAEKLYTRIAFLLEMDADVNRSYILQSTSAKFNYLAEAMLSRLNQNTLLDLDYKLAELFAVYDFQFMRHCIGDVSLPTIIFHHQNVRLLQCCKLASDNIRTAIKVVDSNLERAAYVLTPQSLNQQEQATITERLQPLFSEIFMLMCDELHQLIFNEAEAPALETVIAATADVKIEKIDNKIDEKKQALIKVILDLIAEYFAQYKKYAAFNIPNWCNEITKEKLTLKSFHALDELKKRIDQWGEKTLRHLDAKQAVDDDKSEPIEKPLPISSGPSCLAIYEGSLKYSRHLMLDMSDTCCLLLPFNEVGEVGLDVIYHAKNIARLDALKFERVLAQPTISRNPNQPGIRFLTDSNYFCNVVINRKESCKLIIAEIKIADSPHRIGLYRLTQVGEGKLVLAVGPYIEKGFHDDRYQGKAFQAHALNLSEDFISMLEKQMAAKKASPSFASLPADLTFWPAAASEAATLVRYTPIPEETASTKTKSL